MKNSFTDSLPHTKAIFLFSFLFFHLRSNLTSNGVEKNGKIILFSVSWMLSDCDCVRERERERWRGRDRKRAWAACVSIWQRYVRARRLGTRSVWTNRRAKLLSASSSSLAAASIPRNLSLTHVLLFLSGAALLFAATIAIAPTLAPQFPFSIAYSLLLVNFAVFDESTPPADYNLPRHNNPLSGYFPFQISAIIDRLHVPCSRGQRSKKRPTMAADACQIYQYPNTITKNISRLEFHSPN